jgi:hypothetical protein
MAFSIQNYIFLNFMNQWRFVGLQTSDQPVVRPLPTQDTQHRNTKTNIHASNRIRTHDSSNRAAKIYALDGTGRNLFQFIVTFEIMNKFNI